MTHSENRTHWLKEGLYSEIAGFMYGVTSVVVGHPFDTIKTKMQAEAGYEGIGMRQTFLKCVKTQGIIGLYRGSIPPLLGSGLYRSLQFSVYEAIYTKMDNTLFSQPIPYTIGFQPRVLLAAIAAASARAIIESPLEYAKVRKQTQQDWNFRNLHRGFSATMSRTQGLLCSYLIMVDQIRRHFPDYFARPFLGPFITGGLCASTAWLIVWPLEFAKNQVQSDSQKRSVIRRLQHVLRTNGFFALYRGILPGIIRSFVANGCSFFVMNSIQRKITKLGLRK